MLLFRQFRFDPERLALYRGQTAISLRPKVAQLLNYFLTHPNQLVKREQLLNALWQHGEFREAALNQSITELRHALQDNAKSPIYIKTLPHQGYVWICAVKADSNNKRRLGVKAAIGLVAIALLGGVYSYKSVSIPPAQLQEKAQLLIHPMQNHTGVQANAWWGYALEGTLRERLKTSFHLIPKSQTPDYLNKPEKVPPQQLVLSIKPMQQRYLLQASMAGRHAQVLVEELDNNFIEIADKLLDSLTTNTSRSVTKLNKVNGLSDYYRGVQALNEHGPILAKSYFEAALTQTPDHLPSRLELARIAWGQGNIQLAKHYFNGIDLQTAPYTLRARYHLYLGTFQKVLGEFQRARLSAKNALVMAEQSQHIELMASTYQLMADVAWNTLQWQDYTHAMSAAHALIGSRSFAYSEAQRSFYLANPPAAGPQQKNLVNLSQSKKVLEGAIQYYRQSAQRIELARSLFAYGQNYLVPVSESESSLLEALEIAKESGEQYLTMQVLTYLGFYYIQLHQGEKALYYLEQVALVQAFKPALEQLSLLKAMAYMDIGLTTNRHTALKRAQQLFESLLSIDTTSDTVRANVTLLLGWVALKQGEIDKSQMLTNAALEAYEAGGLSDAMSYAKYTQMYIYLLRNEPDKALKLMDLDRDKEAHLMLFYSSVAAHLTNDEQLFVKTQEMLGKLNNSQALLDQLERFKYQSQGDAKLIAELLDAPYSVYCQSKWILE
ncbi:winged helix-turn-helix domain-containing protein [Pseudoalteromonas sp. SMS1]|uniref:winged helix-turn-helix domain-containing protein n=1 Tax=Pseudoalteromonas sp. SMS1 TaxID=2908894 RepID=UPI001F2D8154|nr:winged helix-turn-helix domain-containing protein [Pseudoalteromonas sp. SMS1]MCF2860275.1 winged helix-turn-helix domain-containing protein [Pseudoalteromonas sp. SMS1]